MLKPAGVLLVFIASIGMAVQIGRDLKNHLYLLYDMRKLLFDIANEMSFSLEPAEIILTDRVHSRSPCLNEICQTMAEELKKKQTGSGDEIWKKVVLQYRREMHLTEEEAEIFIGAGSSFFGKSISENEKGLEHFVKRLDEVIMIEQKEQKEKQKVYQTASIMCGLIIILIFL